MRIFKHVEMLKNCRMKTSTINFLLYLCVHHLSVIYVT